MYSFVSCQFKVTFASVLKVLQFSDTRWRQITIVTCMVGIKRERWQIQTTKCLLGEFLSGTLPVSRYNHKSEHFMVSQRVTV